jgi:hypothetical protein
MPAWSNAYANPFDPNYGKVDSGHYVWVPVHIANGLLDAILPWQNFADSICPSFPQDAKLKSIDEAKPVTGNHGGKPVLGAQEQEFHQQMLQKLALHLAAQPDAHNAEEGNNGFPENVQADGVEQGVSMPLTPQHEGDGAASEGEDEGHASPDGFATPPSAYACASKSRANRSSSECVQVPSYIAQGLLGCMADTEKCAKAHKDQAGKHLSSQDQEFHQQMLRKLALHLAAQPDDSPAAAQNTQFSAPHQTHQDVLPQSAIYANVQRQSNAAKNPKKDKKSGKCIPQEEFHQEILKKLALHLASQPDEPQQTPGEQLSTNCSAIAFGNASEIGEDKKQCDSLIAQLKSPEAPQQVMAFVLSTTRTLSLTQHGTRLVQEAIDVASLEQREQFADALFADIQGIYTSPHANHVLSKLIQSLPSDRLVVIAEAMRGTGVTVARNQFGSRILERLIEHCNEDQLGFLLDELVHDLEALSRHQFGNFVVQRLFEHGSAQRQEACVEKLLPHVLQHATHKTACSVVQCMLVHVDLSSKATIADLFLRGKDETSLESIAATRYGSFVVQQLVDKLHPRIDAVKARIKAARPRLQESSFSQRKIVDFLGEAFFRE